MKYSHIKGLIPILLAIAAAVVLYLWTNERPGAQLSYRLPGADNAPPAKARTAEAQPLRGKLVVSDGVASQLPGSWPRFRGVNFDNIAKVDVELAKSWPKAGPPVLWSIDVGEGYAGAVVLNGRVYLIDYDKANAADAVRCLSLADGREIWRYSYPVKVKRNHGMSRTVPAVTEKHLVTIGPKCQVTCLDAATGEFHWMLDLVNQFGSTVPPWYAGQCPLIDNGRVILAPGGDALLVAVDCNSGGVIWKGANPRGWKMTHSSIVPAEFAGKKMYVYCGSGGVAGVSAGDGSILWDTAEWKIRIANIPSPLVAGEGLIFLSGGYNSGSMMLQLHKQSEDITAETAFKLAPEVFGSPQHTPILYEGYIYGVRPDGQLCCLDRTGKIIWTSGSAHKFGLGPYMIINGLIYLLNDTGTLTLTRATPDGYEQLARAKVLDGPESWGPMAVAEGRLIVRDLNRMICLDIAAR